MLQFQRNRLNKSLTLLDAKNVTLDCAAFYGSDGPIGAHHGIVGADQDMERVEKMVAEVNRDFGALRTLNMKESEMMDSSDNRDLDILPTNLFPVATKEQIARDTLRCKLFHGILIRAVLVVDATKGPKKGKTPKVSDILKARSESLLRIITNDDDDGDDNKDTQKDGTNESSHSFWKTVLKDLARTLVLVSCGLTVQGDDTLTAREQQATTVILAITAHISSLQSEWTPKSVGTTFPSCFLPIISLVKILAKVYALFGWGKRKQRDSVAALAGLADALHQVVQKMSCSVDTLLMSDDLVQQNPDATLLQPPVWKEVCDHVRHGRTQTRERIKTYLEEVSEELETFRVKQ